MNKARVWGVFENQDTTEGRGPTILTKLFWNQSDAQRYSDKMEPYGYSGQFNYIKELTIYDNLSSVLTEENEKIKQRALAKLSQKERQILGY